MIKAKEEQILELIKQNSSVLICLPEHPTTDAIASGLALLAGIEKLGKRGKVVSHGFKLPQNHTFLPKSEEIFTDITTLRKFIISVDVSNTAVEELSYAIEHTHLNIYLTPKDGHFSAKDVTTSDGNYGYDVIIVLDSPDLQSLGALHERNAEFFYHTPIINIDHSTANDHFGQVNMVTVTATSTSEIVFELMKEWGENILDEYIATNLLSGMITKTKSFQSGSVTPRSLAIASHLISQGARREEIVKNLYQSKKISTLKLWGRALSKLESDPAHNIVWSILSQEDIAATKAESSELHNVIDELIINTPEAKHVFLIIEKSAQEVEVVVSTAPYMNAAEIFSDYAIENHTSDHFITLQINSTPSEITPIILQRLQKYSK
ncbi:MAG: DHH family phosphoesterase [Candidatus Kerfeldbacteria bacterium]|nr:DHH family phosphoesterase [Candidatus Kerfeldbacteria bacterium]